MPLSKKDLLDRLAAGDFNALVGEFESDWLECKQAPYQLVTDRHKLELAKDVSGLANAAGGTLLIGFATGKDAAHRADRIDDVKPFPVRDFDTSQYADIVRDWTYPSLSVTVDIYPGADPSRGVAAISVPVLSPAERPILVVKSLLDDDKRTDLLVGYFERKQATVLHYDAARLQATMRDGLRFDVEIRDRFESLQATLKELTNANPAPRPVAFTQAEIVSRTVEALRVVGLSTAPALVLRSMPGAKMDVRELFESKTAPLVKLLERPTEIRNSGFDLSVDGTSHIVGGSLRRSLYPDLKLLEVHRDGMAIFITRGDDEGLCWGRKERQAKANLINQLLLVETVYLFCRFTYDVFKAVPGTVNEVTVEMELIRIASEGRDCFLEGGPISRWPSSRHKAAPDQSEQFSIVIDRVKISPERAAVLLLARMYAWFGFEEDQIPYTEIE